MYPIWFIRENRFAGIRIVPLLILHWALLSIHPTQKIEKSPLYVGTAPHRKYCEILCQESSPRSTCTGGFSPANEVDEHRGWEYSRLCDVYVDRVHSNNCCRRHEKDCKRECIWESCASNWESILLALIRREYHRHVGSFVKFTHFSSLLPYLEPNSIDFILFDRFPVS